MFVEPSYDDDGELVPSQFMLEADCEVYEPACMESVTSETSVLLSQMLKGASYDDQWLLHVDGAAQADAALCVFAPNVLRRPQRCSLTFHGAFKYGP